MFGKQSDPSRTEEATPKRKRKQRQEGNVPKSQELGKVVSIVGGLIILNLWIGPMSDKIKLIFRQFLQNAPTFNVTEESVYALRTDGRPSSLDVLSGLELGRKPVRCFPQ